MKKLALALAAFLACLAPTLAQDTLTFRLPDWRLDQLEPHQSRDGAHHWWNSGSSARLPDSLPPGARLLDAAIWVGVGQHGHQIYRQDSLILGADPLHELLARRGASLRGQPLDSLRAELFVLQTREQMPHDNCQQKILDGGFILYRINSDCYLAHRELRGFAYFAPILLKGALVPPSGSCFDLVLRQDRPDPRPLHLKMSVRVVVP